MQRQEARIRLLADAEAKMAKKIANGSKDKKVKNGMKKRGRDEMESSSKPSSKSKANKSDGGASRTKKKKFSTQSFGKTNPNHKGSIRMAVTDELLPELCRRIGANGTNKRMKTIEDFSRDFPGASVRQVTFKFSEITTRERPICIGDKPERSGSGRSFDFYLRPRLYNLLPEEERPPDWEKNAK